ncbi:MAG: glycogen/starch synthase [Candidatus Omnitrophota bacterium]|nr:glycogen/starch synthase [Candidatus Omnitrophota bacterium]
MAIVCLFFCNDIAFALAPQLRITQKQFSDEYIAGYTKLSHAALNNNIKSKLPPGGIPQLKLVQPEDVDDAETIRVLDKTQKIILVAIKNLAKDTGQLAHIGLGRQAGVPIIYIDKRYFNNATLRNHEKNKITRWESKRLELGKTYAEMRGWILDPATHDEARKFAAQVDREATPRVKKIYESVKGSIDLDNIYVLYSEHGLDRDDNDINIAASNGGKFTENWIAQNIPELKGKTVLSLSLEGNIPEFAGYEAQNANTKGGLGAYFGDKLEGMAAIGINALGAQIGYSHLRKDGKKVKVSYEELIKRGILEKVSVNGDAIMVRAWDEDPEARTEDEEDRYNPKVMVEVYKLSRGGATDYIFMSKVFDELYPDDRAHRFTQEIVFGKAVYAFMKKMHIKPDILHLNEAHTVVAAAQMRADESYNNTAIVYTNHTLVPAGLETFSPASVKSNADRMMYVIGLPKKKAAQLRSAFLRPNGVVDFCYAAMKLADVINAVSNEHAKATERLFRNLYGSEFDKPVVGVLNGSGETWKSDELKAFEDKKGVPSEEDLWQIHENGKKEAFAEIEIRTGVKLDPNKLTGWEVRRLVDYKSQYPMLRFLVHILTADKDKSFTMDELKTLWFRDIPDLAQSYNKGIVESNLSKIFDNGRRKKVYGLGMQLVVGGPEYMPFWVQEFRHWANDIPEFNGRFVYVPNSDAKLLKMQAIGCDLCITNPRPLEEAAGTSDGRAGENGGVNIAIKGAGPVEWIVDYDETTGGGSGFFIGSYTKETDDGFAADNEKFYHEAPADIFAKCEISSRLFYEEGKSKWKHLMRNSYLRANELVTAVAMERRYAHDVYLPAIRKKRNTKTIYEMVLRDYYDVTTGMSGLKSAVKELSFLADSGVKYMYLLGLIENTGSPFEIIDPKNIDKRAGSFKELEDFIKKAHSVGLMVIVDWIANQHVAKSSPLCKSYPERYLYTNVSDGNYGLDRDPKLFRGQTIQPNELRRKIELGEKISAKLKNMDPRELKHEGMINVDGREIPYRRPDDEIRKGLMGASYVAPAIIIPDESALFLVSATDLVSLKTDYPRRWCSLAQPDLSHPDVVRDAIETGRFWLSKGVDGMRVGTALATFPDRIKDNWHIEVSNNLSSQFVEAVRKTNPYAFFMFEGFERYRDLLAVAKGRDASFYGWECRNYATEALMDPLDPSRLQALISYLRSTETMPADIRDNFIYLGPEHDAFDFGDPWSMLSYQDRNLLYFMYTFMPGFNLIFNGEIYGSQHKYRNAQEKSSPVPRMEDADPAKRDVRKKLFSLPALYANFSDGAYHYLETDRPEHAIGLARFGDNDMVIGALNVTFEDGWTTFDMKRIVNSQVEPADMGNTYYVKEGFRLDEQGLEWIPVEKRIIRAEDLLKYGLSIHVGPKGCEFINLKKAVGAMMAAKEAVKPSHAPEHVATFFDLLTNNYQRGWVPFDRLCGDVMIETNGGKRQIAVSTARKDLSKLVSAGLIVQEGDNYHAADNMDGAQIAEISEELSRLKAHATTGEVQDVARRHLESNPSIAPPVKDSPKEQTINENVKTTTLDLDGFNSYSQCKELISGIKSVRSVAIVHEYFSPWGSAIVSLPLTIASILNTWPDVEEISVITYAPELIKNMDPRVRYVSHEESEQFLKNKRFDVFIDFGKNLKFKAVSRLSIFGFSQILLSNKPDRRDIYSVTRNNISLAGLNSADVNIVYPRQDYQKGLIFVNPHSWTNAELSGQLRKLWVGAILELIDKGFVVALNSGTSSYEARETQKIENAVRSRIHGSPKLIVKKFKDRGKVLDFVSQAEGVVTIDTAIFHLALLRGVPAVVISAAKHWIPTVRKGFWDIDHINATPRLICEKLRELGVEDDSPEIREVALRGEGSLVGRPIERNSLYGWTGGYVNDLISEAVRAFNDGRYKEAKSKAMEALDLFAAFELLQDRPNELDEFLGGLTPGKPDGSDLSDIERAKAEEVLTRVADVGYGEAPVDTGEATEENWDTTHYSRGKPFWTEARIVKRLQYLYGIYMEEKELLTKDGIFTFRQYIEKRYPGFVWTLNNKFSDLEEIRSSSLALGHYLDVAEIRDRRVTEMPLNRKDMNLMEVEASEEPSSAAEEESVMRDAVKSAMSILTDRQREVTIGYYGLFGNEPSTQEELSRKYKVSCRRIQQLLDSARRKLQRSAKGRYLLKLLVSMGRMSEGESGEVYNRVRGWSIKVMKAIRDNDKLMKAALNRNGGIPLDKSEAKRLVALGVLEPIENKPDYYRFTDMMIGEDVDYTRTLLNVVTCELAKREAKISRALVRAAILHEINMQIQPAISENKVLWHIIEQGVIPLEQQQGSFITRVNKAFRDNKNVSEKVWILESGTSISEAIKKIRAENTNAMVDIALSIEEHLALVPEDKDIKMLIFKGEDFIQLEGIVAALRALHSDNGLPALLRIYSVMAGKPFDNPPDAISDDPKEFARRLIFDLPKAASAPVNDIPKLNKRLLELLTAA